MRPRWKWNRNVYRGCAGNVFAVHAVQMKYMPNPNRFKICRNYNVKHFKTVNSWPDRFFWASRFLVFSILLYCFCFFFGSVRQIKLNTRQLLDARKHSLTYLKNIVLQAKCQGSAHQLHALFDTLAPLVVHVHGRTAVHTSGNRPTKNFPLLANHHQLCYIRRSVMMIKELL